MDPQPVVSLVVSTYNAEAWLAKVLESVFAQSFIGFELVIADDGSHPETAQLIQRYAARSPVRIKHVWQEDQGFQKCRILNKAIAVSSGERLIFTDGDCVLPPDFVAIHLAMARPGYYLSGGYFKLPADLSERVTAAAIRSGAVFRWSWLLANGLPLNHKLFKLLIPPVFARLANHLTPTKKTWNGHNSSCLRQQAIVVNGFNEEIQYGGQDVEFGLRLRFSGVGGRQLRFSTVPLHLEHGRSYVTPGMRERSLAQRRDTLQQRRVVSPCGLDQWLKTDGSLQLAASDRYRLFNPSAGATGGTS